MNTVLALVALITTPILLAVASQLWGVDSRERPESPEWERRGLSKDDIRPSAESAACRTSVVLDDGTQLVIRPLQATDRPGVKALFERLSPHSLAQRFHSAGLRITDAVLDDVTAGRVLVAEVEDTIGEGGIVALASYYPASGAREAEVGIVVDDAYQGRGIGLAFGTCLVRDAYRAGIEQLRAEVQGSNRAVIKLLRRLNLPLRTTWTHGGMQVEITLEPDSADGSLALDRSADAA
jgi:L-amino acid N-acyltransferase YncA